MSKLIDDLTNDHKILAETLTDIQNMGVTSKESNKKLFAAKNALLAHLKKEDEELYPVLKEAARSDEQLKKTLDSFAKDMESISGAALGFFEKYEKDSKGLDFAKDIGALLSALSGRIRREESIIYKKYNELDLK